MLPDGVAQCEGYGRPSWITKCVILTNEPRVDVPRVICYNVNAELVIDNDGLPQSNNHIAVQIV
jgi:hypothetical protein